MCEKVDYVGNWRILNISVEQLGELRRGLGIQLSTCMVDYSKSGQIDLGCQDL